MSIQTDLFQDEKETIHNGLLSRHKSEWVNIDRLRRIALLEMRTASKDGSKEQWQIAKLAAETARANIQALGTKQTHERLAYGLSSNVQKVEVFQPDRDPKLLSDEQILDEIRKRRAAREGA